jgi:hypothetical protein
MHSLIRSLAFIVGVGNLAAVAHVTIVSTGGYGEPAAAMVVALACGVAVGAVAIGIAVSHRRRTLAVCLVIALLAGEGFGLLRTADMLVTSRDAQQAPIRDAEAKHAAAVARVAAAAKSDAVAKAEAAKATIDANAMAKAAEIGCRKECRGVLEAQVAAASRAVEAARSAVQAEIEAARADLGDNPRPASASPLADRLGVPAWALDLVLAGLGSVGCNGLAACLVAFAAHAPRSKPRDLGQPRYSVPALDLGRPRPTVEVLEPRLGEIDAFMLARVTRVRGAQVSWSDLFTEYLAWCRAEGLEAANVEAFGRSLDALRHELGLRVRKHDGDVFFVGLGINRLRLIAS